MYAIAVQNDKIVCVGFDVEKVVCFHLNKKPTFVSECSTASDS